MTLTAENTPGLARKAIDAQRQRQTVDTLLALHHARYLLYGESETDAPFQVELDRLIKLHESACTR